MFYKYINSLFDKQDIVNNQIVYNSCLGNFCISSNYLRIFCQAITYTLRRYIFKQTGSEFISWSVLDSGSIDTVSLKARQDMKGLKSKNRIKMIKGMTEMSIIITGLYLSHLLQCPFHQHQEERKREMDAQRIKRAPTTKASGCHLISEAK